MKTFTKALVATAAAGAMAVSAATPTFARDGRHDYGISAGEVIAGALVIGGIAAVAASAGNRDRYERYGYDRGNDNYRGYDRRSTGSPRRAIEQCVYAAERDARRSSYGRADVTDIRDVRETRWGWEVRGRIAVNSMGRGWRDGDDRYGRGWDRDYRGWNDGLRGYDSGNFKCRVERGRVTDLDYSGIRGL